MLIFLENCKVDTSGSGAPLIFSLCIFFGNDIVSELKLNRSQQF